MEDNEHSLISYEAVQNYVPDRSAAPDELADDEPETEKRYTDEDLLRVIRYCAALDRATWELVRDIVNIPSEELTVERIAALHGAGTWAVYKKIERVRKRYPELATMLVYVMQRRPALKPKHKDWK